MVEWFLGTMGFGYDDWRGVFYPPGTTSRDYLTHYSRIFNSVEMDTTFYGVPRSAVVTQWAASTPDNFKFCAKLPRTITHEMGLIGTRGLVDEFIDAMRLLGDKLGVILIQFPPSFTSTESAGAGGIFKRHTHGCAFRSRIPAPFVVYPADS